MNPTIFETLTLVSLMHPPIWPRHAAKAREVHWTMDVVRLRHQLLPRELDFSLYRSCPDEVADARAALQLPLLLKA